MINLYEIEEEIKKLEDSECTSYHVCEKLAILYTVHDHLKTKSNTAVEQRSPAPSMMNGSIMK